MLIKNINATRSQGKELLFTCLDTNGTIIDLTALTGSFKIIKSVPEDDDVITVTKIPTLVSATEGKCKVTLTDADLTIDSLQYTYLLTFTFATGENRVLFTGDFVVSGDDVNNRIKQIKQTYGLNYDNYIMNQALTYARKEVNNMAFETVKTDINQTSTTIKVCSDIMDSNYDGSVNENDITLYQYMKKEPYTVEDLNAHIESLTLNNPYQAFITLDAEYPEEDYTLRIEYKRGSDSQDNLQEYINKLEEWYVIKYLFENLDVYKLQHGMTNKDLNGVSITYDQQGITEFQKKIQNQISYYALKTKPFNRCQYNNAGSGGGILKSIQIPKTYNR